MHRADLGEFLLARLTEDQTLAFLAAVEEEQSGPLGNVTSDGVTDPRWIRVLHFSAERLRLEAAVHRQLVEMHRAPGHGCTGTRDGDEPCPTLRLLGLPFADHPEYRPEWRP